MAKVRQDGGFHGIIQAYLFSHSKIMHFSSCFFLMLMIFSYFCTKRMDNYQFY